MSWLSPEVYQPWNIRQASYPYDDNETNQIKHLLGYAVLAPSTFNSQPWTYKITGRTVEIGIDVQRMPQISDKDRRFGIISVGCFIENFVIAAEYYGWKVKVDYNKLSAEQSHNIATITLIDQPNKSHNEQNEPTLLNAMVDRVTNRSYSQPFEIEAKLLNELKALAKSGQSVHILDGSFADELIKISHGADLRIWSNLDFRREHVQWVRHNLTRRPDGMPAYGVGIGLVPSFFAKPVILSSKFAKIQAMRNSKSLMHTNYYLVLSAQDGKKEWCQIGRLFQALGLELTRHGLSLAPMGQFIEDKLARQSLHKLINSPGEPQLFARINKPTKSVRHSPRLAADVMIEAA